MYENLYAQVDEEGRQQQIIDEIIDHRRRSEVLDEESSWFEDKHGKKRRKQTTKGWELLVSFKDGSSNWTPLKELKESFPVHAAEHSRGNNLDKEPAFTWWVSCVHRIAKRTASKVKTKHWRRTHKHGIRLPHSVEEALEFDREDKTDFWQKAIKKEMKNVMVAFEFNDADKVPVAHKQVHLHMMFDIKLESLGHKAWLVADGSGTEPPKGIVTLEVLLNEASNSLPLGFSR